MPESLGFDDEQTAAEANATVAESAADGEQQQTTGSASEPVPDATVLDDVDDDLAAIAADEAGAQLGAAERAGAGLATAPAPLTLGTEEPLVARSIELAREALGDITDAGDVADFVGLVDEGDGLYAARFETTIAGYPGWFWNVSMVRLEGDDDPSVLETELLPGDDALLAPAWVPWAERLAQYEAEHAESDVAVEGSDGEADAGAPSSRSGRGEAGSRSRPLARRERRRVRTRVGQDAAEATPTPAELDGSDEDTGAAEVDEDGFVIEPEIREYADDMDDVLDGVEFEGDDEAESDGEADGNDEAEADDEAEDDER